MQLYTFFRSSTSFRLRIALAYKNIKYEPKFTSLPKMEHRASGYLEVNPQGLVPALVDDAGRVFTQSMAMIEYLDDKYPTPALMPKSAEDKWYVRAVSQIIGCEIHPLNNVRVLKYLQSAYALPPEKVNGDWYPHWIAEGLANLESFLAIEKRAGKYCLGDQFTMADVCLVPQIYNAQRFNCDLKPYPLTMRLAQAANELDCVKVALPETQADKV
jgi:maleylacetoacetate isomerase